MKRTATPCASPFPSVTFVFPLATASKVHARFFPNAVYEEHRDYLLGTLATEERRDFQSHRHKGNVRVTDDVAFFGDRKPMHGEFYCLCVCFRPW